jgi:hypothetical protein
MNYLDCPKCNMKFHQNAVVCPRCNITPEEYQQRLEQKSQQKEASRHQAMLARTLYCTTCGTTCGRHGTVSLTPGSFWIQVVLLFCGLVPGLLYGLWRLSSRKNGCPACHSTLLIPAYTPIARQALAGEERDACEALAPQTEAAEAVPCSA